MIEQTEPTKLQRWESRVKSATGGTELTFTHLAPLAATIPEAFLFGLAMGRQLAHIIGGTPGIVAGVVVGFAAGAGLAGGGFKSFSVAATLYKASEQGGAKTAVSVTIHPAIYLIAGITAIWLVEAATLATGVDLAIIATTMVIIAANNYAAIAREHAALATIAQRQTDQEAQQQREATAEARRQREQQLADDLAAATTNALIAEANARAEAARLAVQREDDLARQAAEDKAKLALVQKQMNTRVRIAKETGQVDSRIDPDMSALVRTGSPDSPALSAQLPPDITRDNMLDHLDNLRTHNNRPLSDGHKQLIRLVHQQPALDGSDLAAELGVTDRTIRRYKSECNGYVALARGQ